MRSALARADFAEDDHDQGGFDAFATEHTEHVERERFYLPAVDILRFLAFFAVFSFHFSPLPVYRWQPSIARSIVSAGQFGVDLFFALSAYLITRLLLSERATSGELHIGSFYARRILRIWPLYFFFLCLAALLSYWRFLPGAFETRPIYFITFFAFVGNFTCSYLGYPQFFLAPLWSISVEEQFYLLWPLALRRLSKSAIVIAAVAMLAVATAARFAVLLFGIFGRLWFLNTLTRLDGIAAGILLASLVPPSVTPLRFFSRAALVIGGCACWFFAAQYCQPPLPLSLTLCYPAVAVGSVAFILAAVYSDSHISQSWLTRWLTHLGKISYGLYVYHGLALTLTAAFMFREVLSWLLNANLPLWLGWPLYAGISFPLTVLLASVSYRWLEAPFLELKDRFTYIPSRPV